LFQHSTRLDYYDIQVTRVRRWRNAWTHNPELFSNTTSENCAQIRLHSCLYWFHPELTAKLTLTYSAAVWNLRSPPHVVLISLCLGPK